MNQITIYELLPLLRKGYVVMDKNGDWWWYEIEPKPTGYENTWTICHEPSSDCSQLDAFNIAPFDGDWKDSLMKCGEKK